MSTQQQSETCDLYCFYGVLEAVEPVAARLFVLGQVDEVRHVAARVLQQRTHHQSMLFAIQLEAVDNLNKMQ